MYNRLSWAAVILFLPAGLADGCGHGAKKASMNPVAPEVRVIDEEYWPDGTLRLQKGVTLRPDGTSINHGTYTRWHKNGRKEYEGAFVDGKVHGTTTSWHRNGQVSVREQYRHGQRHGTRRVWDENGVLRKEEHHVDDKPDGVWTVWDERGRIKWQGTFDRGVPKS